jgi:hypothetical protein
MCALNKEYGIDRVSRASYGILCSEIFDDDFEGHRVAEDSVMQDIDGEYYVKDTLSWLIKRVSVLFSSLIRSDTHFRFIK